jgi:alcohol dehydrogenase
MTYYKFVSPGKIYYGAGSLESLSNVPCQRAFITTDQNLRELGLPERVEKILHAKGVETRVFDAIEAEPSKGTAWKAFALAQAFEPDLFIGLGGGSSMDVGKVAWLLYEHPDLADLPLSESVQEAKNRELRKKARYVAIPTTSGTGSEATIGAVVVDREQDPPFKPTYAFEDLVPDVAILDPELTVSVPPTVTANCGFDALVHAIEPYVCNPVSSDLVDALSLGAARTIFEWLPKAVADGKDIQAREKMHLASLQAGMAISNASLAWEAQTPPPKMFGVHAPGHSLGAVFRIPHGRILAYLLCPVFAYLYPTCKVRLSSLATALSIEGKDDRRKVSNLLDALDHLKEQVGIPLSIKESGLEEQQWLEKIDQVAFRDTTQWELLSLEETQTLYQHAWHGTRAELRD